MTGSKSRKIRSASAKTPKTAGAVKRKKAPKARSPQLQPENFGYEIMLRPAPKVDGGFRIVSGCRDLSLTQALRHWQGAAESGTLCTPARQARCDGCQHILERRKRATNMLALLPKLKQRARRYGWL